MKYKPIKLKNNVLNSFPSEVIYFYWIVIQKLCKKIHKYNYKTEK